MTITYADFDKVDIRVGRITRAEPFPEAVEHRDAEQHPGCVEHRVAHDAGQEGGAGEEPDVVQDMRCEPEQGPERGSGGRPRPGGAGPPRGGRGDAVGGQSRCRGVGQAGVHTVEGA